MRGLFKIAIAQSRLLSKRDFWPGLMHAVIFWGFCVISLRTITLFGMGYVEGFYLPFMHTILGDLYNLTLECVLLLVSIAIGYAFYRRIFSKPIRLTLSWEGLLILGFILTLCLTDFIFEGARMGLGEAKNPMWSPISYLLGSLMLGLPPAFLKIVSGSAYLVHLAIILVFMNFLPYGKHFHVITSLINVFLRRLRPYGALEAINLEDPNATSFGAAKLEDLTWKQILDVATCTECGRCTVSCPAWSTGKPLNPKMISVQLQEHLREQYSLLPSLILGAHAKTNGGEAATEEKFLSPHVIDPEVLWSCTTCRACEEACPVMIEYVDRIVDMRRHLVLVQGSMPVEVQTTFRNMETNSNPWGLSFDDRANWCKDMGVKTLADHPTAEVLYYVGCAGSFDDRNKKIATALVKILQKAKVDFAILGKEEGCTGDAARRIGNEYLFQSLAKTNIETMNRYNVKKVLAACPHCFNTIKNEYPQFGGNYEVMHHTDFVNQLLEEGKIKPVKPLPKRITFHDSCYLGRYNGIYDQPRNLLKSIPGAEVTEAPLSKDNGRCCGAGGGRMWMEEKIGTRVNHKRLEDLQEANPEIIASACPFCLTMLKDATHDKHLEEQIETKDVIEIVAESLG